MSFEGSAMEKSLSKRLWTCQKVDYTMNESTAMLKEYTKI